jgi:hypothetical protein
MVGRQAPQAVKTGTLQAAKYAHVPHSDTAKASSHHPLHGFCCYWGAHHARCTIHAALVQRPCQASGLQRPCAWAKNKKSAGAPRKMPRNNATCTWEPAETQNSHPLRTPVTLGRRNHGTHAKPLPLILHDCSPFKEAFRGMCAPWHPLHDCPGGVLSVVVQPNSKPWHMMYKIQYTRERSGGHHHE